jgi:uncharacterized zinc-type alcohol dehydrogenase-like protein
MDSNAIAASSATTPLAPLKIKRRELRPNDVQIDIAFCGVCHSDLHTVRSEWPGTKYPCVPGHEIVGHVNMVGSAVKNFKKGDLVGVGCMVDSCRECAACKEGVEQYCEVGFVGTYNGTDRQNGENTLGGYSDKVVVDEHFVLRMPKNLDLAASAPLLCAGITLWSPLKHWGAGKGKKVGIVGLGGLGHMGLKLAKALGAQVVLFTTSESKIEDAKRMGASDVIVTKNKGAYEKHFGTLDLIVDTVSVSHNLDNEIMCLKRDGALVLVGAPPTPHPSPNASALIFKRRSIGGSLIGGVKETQEMLDFCGQHGIVCDIEKINAKQINDAYERMLKSDVKYRFVIDIATLT